jgi:hypothetical protein
VELDVMLCNYAEVQSNLLYVAGAGIERSFAAPGSPPPYAVQLALAFTVGVPWDQTGTEHTLHLELTDQSGAVVTVPLGPDQVGTVSADIKFVATQPPGAEAGDVIRVALAANMAGLPLSALGRYTWVFSIDEVEVRRVMYRLATTPRTAPATAPAPRGGGAASAGFVG